MRKEEVCDLKISKVVVKGYRLSLYSLRSINNEKNTTKMSSATIVIIMELACSQASSHFTTEIDVSRYCEHIITSIKQYPGVSIKFNRYSSPL